MPDTSNQEVVFSDSRGSRSGGSSIFFKLDVAILGAMLFLYFSTYVEFFYGLFFSLYSPLMMVVLVVSGIRFLVSLIRRNNLSMSASRKRTVDITFILAMVVTGGWVGLTAAGLRVIEMFFLAPKRAASIFEEYQPNNN